MLDSAMRLEAIRHRLQEAFNPIRLEVIDESYKHMGHKGAKDGRGHFKVIIVDEELSSMLKIAAHRHIYKTLGDLMKTDIHALSIVLV